MAAPCALAASVAAGLAACAVKVLVGSTIPASTSSGIIMAAVHRRKSAEGAWFTGVASRTLTPTYSINSDAAHHGTATPIRGNGTSTLCYRRNAQEHHSAQPSLRQAKSASPEGLALCSQNDEESFYFLLRRWWRVLRSSLRCFFFAIRLRRFLITEPTRTSQVLV